MAALNELGTYYRSAGHYDESARAFEEAGHDILSYGQKDTVDYTTSRINLARTLRLQHQYDRALFLYDERLGIHGSSRPVFRHLSRLTGLLSEKRLSEENRFLRYQDGPERPI